ncbi:glycosyltransferase family 4 protein [Caballeronia grimmiae]|nr:glycosyltransferase [Caballeronia grimmiae]
MNTIHVVLSTEPKGGKGGVATVIPIHLRLLGALGETIHISTHRSTPLWGKLGPWILSFFRCYGVLLRNFGRAKLFHVHPGSGLCLLRMLGLTAFLRIGLRQRAFVYLHTPYLEQYLRSGFWRKVIACLIRLSTRTVVLTHYGKRLLEEARLAEKAVVVPNPYQAEAFAPNSKGDDVRYVLVMGRIVHGKGFVETLGALARLPDSFRLIIAGEGPEFDALRREAEQHSLQERIEWAGWVSGEAKRRLLQKADVFCLPSRVDSFGMSFVEAQCFDLPVVAYRHPPVIEVLKPDQSVIVDSLDPRTLADAILEAQKLSSSIQPGAGSRWITERFGLDRVGQLLEREVIEVSTKK